MAVKKTRRPKLTPLYRDEADYAREIRVGQFVAWQARVWLGTFGGGSLNLGLYRASEWESESGAREAAVRTSRAFVRFFNPTEPGKGLRETFDHLKKTRRFGLPLMHESVLPPRVRRCEGGYKVVFRRRGATITDGKVYECPWIAYEAMKKTLLAKFPPKSRRKVGR